MKQLTKNLETVHMLTNKTGHSSGPSRATPVTELRKPTLRMTHRNELDRVLNALKAYSEQGDGFLNTLKKAEQINADVARTAPPMTDSERAYLNVEAAEADGRTKTGMDTGL